MTDPTPSKWPAWRNPARRVDEAKFLERASPFNGMPRQDKPPARLFGAWRRFSRTLQKCASLVDGASLTAVKIGNLVFCTAPVVYLRRDSPAMEFCSVLLAYGPGSFDHRPRLSHALRAASSPRILMKMPPREKPKSIVIGGKEACAHDQRNLCSSASICG